MDEERLLKWVIASNIADYLRGGKESNRFFQGTKTFSPGTRVYVGEVYWGMGGEKLHVCGLRRISRRFLNCVVDVAVLEDLRVVAVYSPSLIRKLTRSNGMFYPDKDTAETDLARLRKIRELVLPEKLKI